MFDCHGRPGRLWDRSVREHTLSLVRATGEVIGFAVSDRAGWQVHSLVENVRKARTIHTPGERVRRIGEVTGKIPHRWQLCSHGGSLRLAGTLVVEKKEGLVFPDGTAECSPELVLPKNWNGVREILRGIQCSIPKELEPAAMKLVRPRLGHDVDLSATIVPVLGVEVVGNDAKLRDGIEVGNNRGAVVLPLLDIRSVDHEAVGRLALPINRLVTGIQAAAWRTITNSRRSRVRGTVGGHSWLQSQQVRKARPFRGTASMLLDSMTSPICVLWVST